MFFFFDEKEIANIPQHLHHVNKGIFFIKTNLNVHSTDLLYKHNNLAPKSEHVYIEPQVFWASDFNVLFEQILMAIGAKLFGNVLLSFRNLRQEYCEKLLIQILLNVHKAKDVEYTKFELIKYARNFFRILEQYDENINEVFYKLLRGNQKKKVVFLALLFALLFMGKRNKVVILLKNMDVTLQAATHYTRVGIIIRFISFLELTICPIIIIIPCSENIFEEYKEMYNYLLQAEIKSRRPKNPQKPIEGEHLTKEYGARCINCAYLQKINATYYRCPQNKRLPDPNMLPSHFGAKCRLYKPV